MLPLIVKRKVCIVARARFLIWGHTKNDCDHLVNLMTEKCRGSNIYTSQDLYTLLGLHEDSTVVVVESGDFLNWDVTQKKHMKQPPNIKDQHVFLASAHKDSERLYAQDFEGGHMCSAAIVKKESIGLEWWKDAMPLIEAPFIIQSLHHA